MLKHWSWYEPANWSWVGVDTPLWRNMFGTEVSEGAD